MPDILEQYTEQYDLKRRVKTTDLGSLFEVDYHVVVKNDTDEKTLLDELRCRNGNLSIILSMAPAE